jgi:Fungal specific transcription factor domain
MAEGQLDIMSMMPGRKVVDYLVNHFLREGNWIYEMIIPEVFLEKYHLWWSASHPYSMEDVQFAALLLRLCSHAIQYLPNTPCPVLDQLDSTLDEIQSMCESGATRLDDFSGHHPSLLRLQQLFFYVCYLKNEGRIKQSWRVFSEAVNDIQDIGLHLDTLESDVNEHDKEISRRTFWNFYIWDRYESVLVYALSRANIAQIYV